jgi:hypothetical protein
VRKYACAKQRLLVLGYNATLTTAVEAPRQPKRHFDQIKVLLLHFIALPWRVHMHACMSYCVGGPPPTLASFRPDQSAPSLPAQAVPWRA